MGHRMYHGRLETKKHSGMGCAREKTGGAEHTMWEAMLELEPYGAEAGPKNPGAVTAHKDLQTTFTNILLIEVWKLVNVLEVHSLVATMAVWVFSRIKNMFFASANIDSKISRGGSFVQCLRDW